MDMFTREGNIPYTNRNEKPTAATKQPPAASPPGRCMYTRKERESREQREQEAGCTERERKTEEGGNHGGEDRTEPEPRQVGDRLKSLLSLSLSPYQILLLTTTSFQIATPRITPTTDQLWCTEYGYNPELF